MLNKTWVMILLLCIVMSACSGGNRSESGGSSKPVSPSSSEPAPSPIEDQPPQYNVLNTVLAVSAADFAGFSYDGNAPYYFGGERGIWSEMGYSAIVFSCPDIDDYEKKHLEQEKLLVEQFAEALSRFEVDGGFVEDMTSQTTLPACDYMSFAVSLSGGRYQYLTFFESGDIYLSLNDGEGTPARHYRAADADDYTMLQRAVGDVRAGLDALPLDYQLRVAISPDSFKPESAALRMLVWNIGAQPVEFLNEFMIEKQENGAWRQLSEKEPMAAAAQTLSAEPRGEKRHTIELANWDGGQEPGHYRVTNTFYAGNESLPVTIEYEINPDAMDISYPFSPEMTPEYQGYYDKYLGAWGFYCPFSRDYTEQTFAREFRPYLLYQSSVFQEGRQREYDTKFGADIPAEVVEATVTRHFPVTAEQFRASLLESGAKSEYYDPDKNVYHFEGGYGGGSSHGVVTDARRDGDLLILSCDWYGMDDSFGFSHTVTIRLGAGEDAFYYMENTVTKRAKTE